jgi:hypothetical protein
MNHAIEFEQEEDGRWIADVPSLPGLMVYGDTKEDAEVRLAVMALSIPSFAKVWNNPEDDVYNDL